MNLREKILAIVTGALVGGWLLYVAADKLLLSPAGKLDAQAKELQKKIIALKTENQDEEFFRQRLKTLSQQTFGAKELTAKERVSARLLRLVARSGLSSQNLSLDLASGAQKRGAYREIAGTISASGRIERAIDFLYLLGQQPYLHRLENLSVVPQKEGQMRMRVKYATLIVQPPEGVKLPTTRPASDKPAGDLDSDSRKQYKVIASRNLFLPYIQKRPERVVARGPVPQRREERRQETRPPPKPTGRLQVADLSSWAGQPEAVVLDTKARTTRRYKVGESLGEGKIVHIDYRRMPMPRSPELISTSRLILKFEKEYYAVELGQSLTDRRPLKPEELPAELRARPAATTRPAAGAPDGQAARREEPAGAKG